MKNIILFIFCICCLLSAKADHITGGEMFYTCKGAAGGEYQYQVTLKLFMRCNSGRQFADPTIISVFDRVTGERIKDVSAPLGNQENISITSNNPCISDPPLVCYVTGYFYFNVSLPASANGYLLSSQVNFRIAGINNFGNYVQVGATYTAEIPGTVLPDAPKNNSAFFTGTDLVTVCADNSFTYSFAATDADGDALRYSFCNAYAGGNGGSGSTSSPASPPPYASVPYGLPDFSSGDPLGGRVKIDPNTGLITGTAPAEGKYVVTVCVQEIRGGVVIATQRKDLQINIASCTIAAATLEPQYMLCRDTKTITLENLSTSSLIKTYEWQLSDARGNVIFNSTDPRPSFSFPDTGLYQMKLTVNKNDLCSDSASAPVKVYPGFVPQFSYRGICIKKPVVFTDASTSVFGTATSWSWNFGEPSDFDDISYDPDPSYTYPGTGVKHVRLVVANSKGCVDTAFKDIAIVDKPPVTVVFRDTLICVADKVQLQAGGVGTFSWTPAIGIINPLTEAPTVSPSGTTTYYVTLDDNGCSNIDSVNVRVVDHVSLQVMPDTVICSADSIRLHVVSNALRFAWSPAAQLIDARQPNAIAVTKTSTQYRITASIGGCSTSGNVQVTAVAYPVADAGTDTTICFLTTAQLHGSVSGKSFLWKPAISLSDATTLDPVARPAGTTAYVLLAFDTKGCPKPGADTVLVKMLPAMHVFAGNDTTIVTNQPLQLHASGGLKYVWTPATYLSSASIANPVAIITTPNAGLQYRVLAYNEANCVDAAFIRVKVYKTPPSVFVPNAFTPNGDGKNDLLRPVMAGIQRIAYFSVYNRWGQLVYQSSDAKAVGWNGQLAGKDQPAGSYVWIVSATDYNGNAFIEKGTVLLIRYQ